MWHTCSMKLDSSLVETMCDVQPSDFCTELEASRKKVTSQRPPVYIVLPPLVHWPAAWPGFVSQSSTNG